MRSKKESPPKKRFLKPMKEKSAEPEHEGSAVPGVYESASHAPATEDRQIELMLATIIDRLERIEEKIDENVYPPESAIKPDVIRRVKKAQADIRKGKGKTYNSINDFFKEIEA